MRGEKLSKKDRELLEKDETRKEILTSNGYRYISISSCEWALEQRTSNMARWFTACCSWGPEDIDLSPMSEQEILDKISETQFFGYIRCNVAVDREHADRYGIFPACFKSANVKFENIGIDMQKYCVKHNLFHPGQVRKQLIPSQFFEQKLISSDYAAWLMEHNHHIYEITEAIQWKSNYKPLESFVNICTNERAKAAKNDDKLLVSWYKFICNRWVSKNIGVNEFN